MDKQQLWELTVAGITFIFLFQVVAFSLTQLLISQFRNFFSSKLKSLWVSFPGENRIELSLFKESKKNYFFAGLENFIQPTLEKVIRSTNIYLLKNENSSANFEELKNICERHLASLEEKIQSLISTPLYLGLAGTFIGLIIGLFGLNLNEILSQNQELSSIDDLLKGVRWAISASLLGLIFTIINSVMFSWANSCVHTGKNEYYDFLQEELVPVLAKEADQNFSSLRSILTEFTNNFGKDLKEYGNNLEKQKKVLEIMKDNAFAKTAGKLVHTFQSLEKSADGLAKFQEYQGNLNEAMVRTTTLLNNSQNIAESIASFKDNAQLFSKHTLETKETFEAFKAAIELHFPTREDYRAQWREEINNLHQDAQKASQELAEHLENNSKYIKQFIDDNNQFFSMNTQMEKTSENMLQYAKEQKESYTDLKKEMTGLRQDFSQTQQENLEVQKQLVEAIQSFIELRKEQELNSSQPGQESDAGSSEETENYKEEVKRLTKEIKEYQEEIDILRFQIGDYERKINSLTNEIDAQKEIENQNKDEIKNLKIEVLQSWTESDKLKKEIELKTQLIHELKRQLEHLKNLQNGKQKG